MRRRCDERVQAPRAVVTGAASGIGCGLADRFAAECLRVVLADVERDPLARAATEMRDGGTDALDIAPLEIVPLEG